MRTAFVVGITAIIMAACASKPPGGVLSEGGSTHPTISAVDSSFPPRGATVQLESPGYAALFLVAPGHSATLLYPPDSASSNRLTAGTHDIRFDIPGTLAETDSQRIARMREAQRTPTRSRSSSRRALGPIPQSTPTFLLLLTSQQPLVYQRMIEKTGGVSIPNIDMEALNAVAKAVKSTIASEPRDWSGFYQPVELRRYR